MAFTQWMPVFRVIKLESKNEIFKRIKTWLKKGAKLLEKLKNVTKM